MGGTDNHIVLLDCRPHGLTGSKVEKACDLAHITINKNTLLGDKSAMTPGGIRIGTPAVTTRGYLEKDMEQVAKFITQAINISVEVQKKHGKKLKDFTAAIEDNWAMKNLADKVEDFALQFDIPGINSSSIDRFCSRYVINNLSFEYIKMGNQCSACENASDPNEFPVPDSKDPVRRSIRKD